MKTPTSWREISKKWVQHILREYKAASDSPGLLHVDTCTVSEDLGDGYNSQVVFFSVETTEKDDGSDSEVKKTYHLVAKLLSQNPQSQVLGKKFKTNLREYLIYTDIINNLNKILCEKAPEEPQISLPKLIYGKCTSKDFVLVLENLQYAGYEMNDKYKGLNGEQLLSAVDKIARIHAVSHVFYKTADLSKYSCFPSVQDYLSMFSLLMGGMLKCCVSFLKHSKETEELGKKIESSIPSLNDKISSGMSLSNSFKCLVHGDFWNNNFMLKYTDAADGQRTIEELMIIDWGNCSWGSPVFDLQYLIHTSTQLSVRRDHLEEVLSHYHSTFTRLTTQLGHPLPNWGLTQLKAEWEESYPLGFLCGCALTQGTLSTQNPIHKKPKPTLLDKPLLLPIKVIVNGMKVGMAKVVLPLSMSSGGKKIFESLMIKMVTPIVEELKAGTNEVMNTRLLDLLHEADDKGVFST